MKKFVYFSGGFLLIFIGLFLMAQLLMNQQLATSLTQLSTQYHWVFSCWRYALYGLLLLFWPKIVGLWGVRQGWSQEVIDYLSNQRLKLLLLFVLVELLFTYNLIFHVLAWL